MTRTPARITLFLTAVLALVAACQPTRGYHTGNLTSQNQNAPVPDSVGRTGGAPALQTGPRRDGGRGDPEPGSGGPGVCTQDSDCVRAQCCHATSCVPRAQAPGCGDVMCTQDCRPGTLDCGGRCACEGGFCVARYAQRP